MTIYSVIEHIYHGKLVDLVGYLLRH